MSGCNSGGKEIKDIFEVSSAQTGTKHLLHEL